MTKKKKTRKKKKTLTRASMMKKIRFYSWRIIQETLLQPLKKYLKLIFYYLIEKILFCALLIFIAWLLLRNHWPFSWFFDMLWNNIF